MRLVTDWTVDYGSGPMPIRVPHAWRHDVPVAWEGPAIYRTRVAGSGYLVFRGVSYEATVSVEGKEVLRHRGIWDTFSVPLPSPGDHDVEVRVVKNGGPTFPVRDVASGFLPFVFHTFGGIFGEVEYWETEPADLPPVKPRIEARGSKLLLDGEPYYPRGILHWGWYPEIGHPNPPEDLIRREVETLRDLGFNLVKFCLWIPPHRYLDLLSECGLTAWLELPLWDPSPDRDRQREMAEELERIVRQYAHHESIILWTVGCELSTSTPFEYRRNLVEMVRRLVPGALVKDNSGGAEMYGGDLREFGDFDDFHPYCDTMFYPPVLDSLLPGPRNPRPLLLGEFNDIDVHRDLARIETEQPYWAAADPALNDQGVRWQHDLPTVKKFDDPDLIASSRSKAVFIRKFVQEAVRARSEISGWVITGIRDTPISSSGFLDDWDQVRFTNEEVEPWMRDEALFLIPSRRPPWVRGGNRPGWRDPHNHFAGSVHFRLGAHSVRGCTAEASWRIGSHSGCLPRVEIGALESVELGEFSVDLPRGAYLLEVELGSGRNRWPIWVVEEATLEVDVLDALGLLAGVTGASGPVLATHIPPDWHDRAGAVFLTSEGTIPMPFWREAAYKAYGTRWGDLGFDEHWPRILPISPDCALDPAHLRETFGDYVLLLERVDTRTYARHPILVEIPTAGGLLFVTTLRPFGGLGCQPHGIRWNPAGWALACGLIAASTQVA